MSLALSQDIANRLQVFNSCLHLQEPISSMGKIQIPTGLNMTQAGISQVSVSPLPLVLLPESPRWEFWLFCQNYLRSISLFKNHPCIFSKFYFYLWVCMCVSHMCECLQRPEECIRLELELHPVVCCLTWVLGTEFRSSGRATSGSLPTCADYYL